MKAARRVVGEIVGLYWESGVADDVPALAWFLLSSLAPLALGVTALATLVLGDYSRAQALAERIARVLPRDVHQQIVELILRTKQDSPLLIIGSIVAMLWISSGAVGVLARCLSRLLAVPGAGIVLGKLRNLAVAAALSILIVLMVIVASAASGLARRLGLEPTATRIAVPLLSTALTVVVCGGVYFTLASGNLDVRPAAIGGMVGAVILQATPTAAGYYLSHVAGRTPAELFLVLAGILFTCYLAALGLLLGVGVTARVQLGRRLGGEPRADGEQHNDHRPGSRPAGTPLQPR